VDIDDLSEWKTSELLTKICIPWLLGMRYLYTGLNKLEELPMVRPSSHYSEHVVVLSLVDSLHPSFRTWSLVWSL
jgi:hypothetical protein